MKKVTTLIGTEHGSVTQTPVIMADRTVAEQIVALLNDQTAPYPLESLANLGKKSGDSDELYKLAITGADATIALLDGHDLDYSTKREDLATVFVRLSQGDYDCTTSFQDGTPDLRFIKTEEYEAMNTRPSHKGRLCTVEGFHVFPAATL
jgi:hypothetical protein